MGRQWPGSGRALRGRLVAMLAWLALAGAAVAQSYTLRTFTEYDGLANSSVLDIAEEPNGVLWIQTRGGLARFDGHSWTRFAVPFDNAALLHLVLDRRGIPWCIGPRGAIYSLEDGEWVSHGADDSFSADSRFVIAINDSGERPIFAAVTAPGGARLSRGGSWKSVGGDDRNANLFAAAVVAWRGGFLFGIPDGLIGIDSDGRRIEVDATFGVPEGRVLGLAWAPDSDRAAAPELVDGLWLVSDRWIGVVERGRFACRAELAEPVPTSPAGFLRTAASPRLGLFYGNEVFGRHLAPGAPRPVAFDARRGLPSDGLQALTIDREHNLWIGQRAGITRLSSLRFQHFDYSLGLAEDEVAAVLELADGRVVLGHGRALSMLDGERITTRELPPEALVDDAFPRVISLRSDGRDGYFAALWTNALLHVDARGAETVVDGLVFELDHVADVDASEPERLWIGGGCGAVAVERETLRELPGTRLGTHLVRRFARGLDGTLYGATAWRGVVEWRDGWWHSHRAPEYGPLDDTWCVRASRDGRVWVGTRAGLALLTADGLRPGPVELGANIGPVYAITESPNGELRLGTSDGMLEWDGASVRRTSIEHGLVGREVNRGAFHVDARGRLWIGTDRGLSIGAADADEPAPPAPHVELTDFEVAGRRVDPHAAFEFDASTHALLVRGRAVSFVDEHQVGYRWRLDGFETNWSTSVGTTAFELRYANLPPGRYRFELAARAFGGDWSEPVRSAEFGVQKPLWRRTWFAGFVSIAALAVGWFVQRAIAQRRYTRRLAAEVEVRTRELSLSRAEVLREKERLHATLESIQDCVVAVDADRRVAWSNSAAERALGAPSEELVGRPVETVVRIERGDGSPLDAAQLCEPIAIDDAARASGLRLLAPRGESRPIELAVAPLSHDGARTGGAVIVLRDVSERTRLEREVARDDRLRSLGILAGGIAHDFNNVLTAVGGRVSLITLAASESTDVGKHSRAAEKALERARDLAHQLLTFARGGEPVRASLAIDELVRDAYQLAFSGSGIRAVEEFESQPWPVEVDRTQVQQLLENLLINARQAMPSGGRVVVRVHNEQAGRRQHPALSDGRYVRVDVEDEGAGIAHEHLQHVFDPFFTTKPGGSGLGLATAYSVVQRHGGAITVRSRVGSGTCFSVYLPASERSVELTPIERRDVTRVHARVLVVDDESEVRAVLDAVLTHLGARVVCTASEDEAVERWLEAGARGEPFDAALLDLTMPGGAGGVSIARRVLDADPEARLIAMSGYASDPVLAHPARYGFRATLVKPFRMHEVTRALELARNDGVREQLAGLD
ncbi:MAG: response regulator [Planctomycetes bacterium]|nr:response regulator [Planctomycetota bacterium]